MGGNGRSAHRSGDLPCLDAFTSPQLLAVLFAAPDAAGAATVLDTRLAASGTAAQACHQALRPGAPGVQTRVVLVQSAGQVEVRLAGGDGDWDVALFDGTGNAVAAAASPDSQEIASGWVLAPGTLTLQACRNSGTGARPGDRHPHAGDRRRGAGARGRAADS